MESMAIVPQFPANEREKAENLEDSDVEDFFERNEYEIEKEVVAFVDEPRIHHNVYPESEDNEEKAPNGFRNREHMRRGDGRLEVGMSFINGFAFKEVVLDYVLRTGRNIKQYRYDNNKIGYMCVGSTNCGWRVYCSLNGKSDLWKIRVYNGAHACSCNGECEMFKVPVIARLFFEKIQNEPDYFMPLKMAEIILAKWGIVVSRPQCQAGRYKALKWIEKEYDEQFARLRDYGAEILISNPYSTVEIDTYKNELGQDVFNRLYVCFDVIRRTWKNTCRPLIGVDGCFIRSKMKGQLLVAIGRDSNNAMYPIAWGVVQVENTENWLWFIQKIKSDLQMDNGEGYVMISDRQKGLIRAVSIELPKIEHRMCVRHIYSNLKKKHGKKTFLKMLLWNVAWSYNDADYHQHMDRLLNYDSAVYADVIRSNPKTWCRAFYKQGSFCEDVENNTTESFNASIVKAREKAFVPMLETIRKLAMVRIVKRYMTAIDHKGVCTPYVEYFLAAEHKTAVECRVSMSTNGMYEVVNGYDCHRVSLERRSCTCQKYDICGIPCVHAYGAIISKKLKPEDYVCEWFKTYMWRNNYVDGIVPLRGARFWPSTTASNVHQPPQPPQPGRKKTNTKEKRKKGVNESPSKRQRRVLERVMHCGVCGAANHNSRFHKNQRTQTQGARPSQGESSQGVLTQLHLDG